MPELSALESSVRVVAPPPQLDVSVEVSVSVSLDVSVSAYVVVTVSVPLSVGVTCVSTPLSTSLDESLSVPEDDSLLVADVSMPPDSAALVHP
jgi:hypothetical protein